jgi:hypothetical protein
MRNRASFPVFIGVFARRAPAQAGSDARRRRRRPRLTYGTGLRKPCACVRNRRAYSPSLRISASWLPCSAMLPSRSTTMRSARRIPSRRWPMSKPILPVSRAWSWSRWSASASGSRPAEGSQAGGRGCGRDGLATGAEAGLGCPARSWVPAAQGDVVVRRQVVGHEVLEYGADARAQFGYGELPDVGAIPGDAPAGGLVEPAQQLCHGGLASAIEPTKPTTLSGAAAGSGRAAPTVPRRDRGTTPTRSGSPSGPGRRRAVSPTHGAGPPAPLHGHRRPRTEHDADAAGGREGTGAASSGPDGPQRRHRDPPRARPRHGRHAQPVHRGQAGRGDRPATRFPRSCRPRPRQAANCSPPGISPCSATT